MRGWRDAKNQMGETRREGTENVNKARRDEEWQRQKWYSNRMGKKTKAVVTKY